MGRVAQCSTWGNTIQASKPKRVLGRWLWVKVATLKAWGPECESSSCVKTPGITMHTCNPSAGEARVRCLRVCCPTQQAELTAERICLRKKGGERLRDTLEVNLWPLRSYIYAPYFPYTWTQTHIYVCKHFKSRQNDLQQQYYWFIFIFLFTLHCPLPVTPFHNPSSFSSEWVRTPGYPSTQVHQLSAELGTASPRQGSPTRIYMKQLLG